MYVLYLYSCYMLLYSYIYSYFMLLYMLYSYIYNFIYMQILDKNLYISCIYCLFILIIDL